MRRIVEWTTLLVVGALLGAWLEGAICTRLFILGLFGLLLIITWILFWQASKLWPSKDTLRVTHSEMRPRTRTMGIGDWLPWSSHDPQWQGAYIEIDFLKGRRLESVEFDMDSGNEIPLAWRMFGYSADGRKAVLSKKGQVHIDGRGIIAAAFSSRLKVQRIHIQILEVNQADTGEVCHWTINNIDFWERKLFNRVVRPIT